ncbi:MAG: tripartite tricarboxylate transporter permease [archaeon]|nr:tripartite tricarboxylate transporter permease [archaeon]
MIEEINFLLIGIIAGTITGLIPGLHANTIALITIYSPLEKNIGFALFVISMSITHSFVDAIPTILLGAPSEESFLSVLPGHRMLLQGKGFEAIQLTIFGGLFASITALLLMPFFFSFTNNYSETLPIIIPAILFGTLVLLLFSEKNKLNAIIVILFSSILGIIVLNSGIKNPVLALVIGFFAIPSLLQSIFSDTKIPEQKKSFGNGSSKTAMLAGFVSGLISIFPGIGPSQAAFVSKKIFRNMGKRGYLTIIGGINTANLLFSLLMLLVIGKTRTGMTVALNNIISVDMKIFPILLAGAVVSVGLATIVSEFVAGEAIKITKMNYQNISKAILIFLVFIVIYLSGIMGLIVALSATGISLFGLAGKVKRSLAMSFLMVPTMLFYLGIVF